MYVVPRNISTPIARNVSCADNPITSSEVNRK